MTETKAIQKHKEWKGKIEVISRSPVETREDLSIAYTPGVAEPCQEIYKDEELAYKYTRKGNLVAVITDGTAVLGLGDIGPSAAMPVMEGKCVLLKEFANVDAFPICIDSKDPKVIIETIVNISKSFGGINLEDIAAPRCFEIEAELQKRCDIPVFHDDQHGTAIVTAAALINGGKLTGRKFEDMKVVINGAGAAGSSVAGLFLQMGVKDLILCDKEGAIFEGMEGLNERQSELSKLTNKDRIKGSLAEAMKGADAFIGVSRPGMVTEEMIKSMAKDPIVFAMANPTPEIMPDLAKRAGAKVVGTGRSDFPNQVNNVLAFPGIFRGLLDSRAKNVTEEMKIAAAIAIAQVIPEEDLREDYVLPDAFDARVCAAVSKAVAEVEKGTK